MRNKQTKETLGHPSFRQPRLLLVGASFTSFISGEKRTFCKLAHALSFLIIVDSTTARMHNQCLSACGLVLMNWWKSLQPACYICWSLVSSLVQPNDEQLIVASEAPVCDEELQPGVAALHAHGDGGELVVVAAAGMDEPRRGAVPVLQRARRRHRGHLPRGAGRVHHAEALPQRIVHGPRPAPVLHHVLRPLRRGLPPVPGTGSRGGGGAPTGRRGTSGPRGACSERTRRRSICNVRERCRWGSGWRWSREGDSDRVL